MRASHQRWLADFYSHIENERRLSANTLKSYRRDLLQFHQYCDNNNIEGWQNVTVHEIRGFVGYRHRTGLSGRSIQRELSSIRRFFEYLVREGELKNNPAQGIRAPKYLKPLPKTLDVDEVGHLLDCEPTGPVAIRDLAMMELMYSCGLRLSELVSVKLNDIDLLDGSLPITGKGNKTRILPVGRVAINRLQAWLKVRPNLAAPGETAMFVSQRGKSLSVRAIQQRMYQWGLQRAVSSRVHPHRLRHSFASHMLESSGNLRAVQELLGHTDISTTQVYTHLDFQHLATVYDKAHPRAKKNKNIKS